MYLLLRNDNKVMGVFTSVKKAKQVLDDASPPKIYAFTLKEIDVNKWDCGTGREWPMLPMRKKAL